MAFMLLGSAATACAQPRDADREARDACSVQVIVTLASSPDDALVADLARVSGAHLELVRTMTSNLHLFAVSATGSDAACTEAVEKLRGDPRVRAVDLDRRRQIQSR